MSTAIICIILILIAVFGIRSYTRKLTSGCCGSPSQPGVKKIKVKDQDKSHYPYSRVLKVDGMTCGGCAVRVENGLNRLEGIWARVSLDQGEALVLMKKDYPVQELKQAVRDSGYIVYKVEERQALL